MRGLRELDRQGHELAGGASRRSSVPRPPAGTVGPATFAIIRCSCRRVSEPVIPVGPRTGPVTSPGSFTLPVLCPQLLCRFLISPPRTCDAACPRISAAAP